MRTFLFTLTAALLALPAIADAAPLRGVVVDPDGAPVPGAQVLIAGQEVTTDDAGRFVIPDGPDALDDVVVTALGFEPLLDQVRPGRVARIVLTRATTAVAVEEIVLQDAAPFVTAPPAYDLGAETVTSVAGAGNDALKALQSLPGVARIPFGLGGLVLRGKSPRSSNVFFDGVEVPLLYHFGGLASFVPTSMIESLELSPGSYGVRWSRGIGGVVDVRSRAPLSDRWRAGGEVSLLDAQARAEGPLAGGGVGLGFRRSYVDAVLAAAAPSLTLAPRYLDAQLRWDRGDAEREGGRWTAAVFGSDDRLTFTDGDGAMDDGTDLTYRSRFVRAALTWRRSEGPWSTTITPSIGGDEVSLRVDGEGITRRNLPLALRTETTRTWKDARLAGGVDLVGTRHTFDINNEPPPSPTMTVDTPDMPVRRTGTRWSGDAGAWVEGFYQWGGGALGVTPGLRLDRFGLADQWVLDPRLAVSSTQGGVTITGAVGRYHEPPSFADVDPVFGNQDLRASSSVQASLGVTVALPEVGSFAATAFVDRSTELPVDAVSSATAQATGGLQGGGVQGASRELTDEQFGSYSYRENTGRGRGGGVELLVRKRTGAWTGWAAYTYARAFRRGDPDVDPVWRPYILDQPHVLTALASVPISAWQLGGRIRVASGNPITPVARAYYDAKQEEYVAVDGAILSERLPAFVQLDLRVERTWTRPWGTTSLFLDLQNATNRLNPEGVSYSNDYARRDYTRGLPIFPSIGVTYQP